MFIRWVGILHEVKNQAVFVYKGCIEGEVRLLEGTSPLEGRVEVCKNNIWGTVCHTAWTFTDAKIVCRQLGFSVAGEEVIIHIVKKSLHNYTHFHTLNLESVFNWKLIEKYNDYS